MFMYWHRHSPSNLLNRAFSEYKNNTNQDSNSWYSNLLLYSKKINIDLAVCKDFGKSKFKFLLKTALKNNFLNVWNEIRNTYVLDKGKLNTYFKYKTSFNLENYLIVKNLKIRHIDKIQT